GGWGAGGSDRVAGRSRGLPGRVEGGRMKALIHSAMSENLLTLSGVQTHIGAYHILHGVDLAVPRGQLTMLLGRNGAGKTTTLRTIMGLWRASQGRIVFNGQDITATATPQIASMNVAYVPENMGIFS